jgi:hypothetical protein
MRSKTNVPADVREALTLVDRGILRQLEHWIHSGRQVRSDSSSDWRYCCLRRACERGFHSVVEVLLGSVEWAQQEKDDALNFSMRERRLDLVELLLAHGARPQAIDFDDVCRTMDLPTMERFLKAGVDPSAGNAFARALCEFKARPLLRFYKSSVREYPSLERQMALALACAAREKNVRWAALLRWAGADPLMKVPCQVHDDWDFDEYGGTTATEIACFSGDASLVKALKLRIGPELLQELLKRVTWHPSVDVLKELLRAATIKDLNAGERRSCEAVEAMVERRPFDFSYRGTSKEQEENAMVDCLEVLLDAGARWNPAPERIGSIRKKPRGSMRGYWTIGSQKGSGCYFRSQSGHGYSTPFCSGHAAL